MLRRQVARARPAGVREARRGRRRGVARRRVRVGWGERRPARAARREPGERLGGREDPVLPHAPRPHLQPGRAQRHVAELLHLRDGADAPRPGRLAAASGRARRAAARAVARRLDAPAARLVHGETPLRRGVVRDRELARRAGLDHRRAVPPAPHGALLRLYSPTKLGYKMTKYLVSMTFTDRRPGGYWEDQGYPWFAGI